MTSEKIPFCLLPNSSTVFLLGRREYIIACHLPGRNCREKFIDCGNFKVQRLPIPGGMLHNTIQRFAVIQSIQILKGDKFLIKPLHQRLDDRLYWITQNMCSFAHRAFKDFCQKLSGKAAFLRYVIICSFHKSITITKKFGSNGKPFKKGRAIVLRLKIKQQHIKIVNVPKASEKCTLHTFELSLVAQCCTTMCLSESDKLMEKHQLFSAVNTKRSLQPNTFIVLCTFCIEVEKVFQGQTRG